MARPLIAASACRRVAAFGLALGAARACAAGPLLGYVQERNGSFELRVADPAKGTETRVQSLLERPALTIWRKDRPEVVTLRESGLYQTDYAAAPGTASPVGDAAPPDMEVHDGWVGKDGRSLYFVASARGGAAAGRCVLYLAPASGAWQAQKVPAPAAAAQADCDGFAGAARADARSATSLELMRRQQCATAGSACDQLGGEAGDAYAAVRGSIAKAARGVESVAIADPGATAFFVAAGVRVGDMPHLASPVHLVARQGARVQAPALRTPPQVQIGLVGDYALVAGEFDGRDPLVLDLKTGRVALAPAKAQQAVWLPR